jgi:lambda repressor-like predicted transcriptional regulator
VTATKPITTSTPESLLQSVPLLRAFMECSDELQAHAKNMVKALCNPELDEDERFLAATTLFELLFPYHDEDDGVYGMDLEHAERVVRNHPFPDDDPQGKECDQAAAVLDVMDAEEETFAVLLQAAMTERGLTQTALAAKVGVSQPAIALMLKRECRPQKRTVSKIAKALGMRPSELWPQLAEAE